MSASRNAEGEFQLGPVPCTIVSLIGLQHNSFLALTNGDKQWIAERLEAMETRLLSGFQQWASPTDARQRSHSAALRALDVEQEYLSDRITKLEGGAQ